MAFYVIVILLNQRILVIKIKFVHLILGATVPDINDAVDERDGKLCKFFRLNWIYLTVSFILFHFRCGNEYRLLH